ncbi:MAG: hypothetical protein JNN11_00885 [Candidatus Doudnabacteria bacterium]|nr:hypothetical protein [Candidatus Doudnabacteria bacterium]
MNKKNLIQVLVIVACFAASGIVIYNNFLKKPALPSSQMAPVSQAQVEAPILPNGSAFDLAPVKNSKLRFNLIEYPRLNFNQDVGLPEDQVLKPLRVIQDGSGSN